ncbi:DUF4407 domain-containing protein [Flavobacteriales bacterium]|nr:DUF4407 domain-containing protein [Flavobacteriales bacterium]
MKLKNIIAKILWWASGTQSSKEDFSSSYVKHYGIGAIFVTLFLLSFFFGGLIINEKIEDDFSVRVEKNIPYKIYFSEFQEVEDISINDDKLQVFHDLKIKKSEIPDSINSYIESIDKGKNVTVSYISDTKLSIVTNAFYISLISGFLLACVIFFVLQYIGSIPEKLKKIQRFFWWCAGCDISILEKHKEEHSKYFGVGGTVLFTAMMATLAGGYGFYTAFGSDEATVADSVTAIFFGVFWGALIFNLDRYIVSTFGVGDGKKSISWNELVSALPRVIIAIVLGLVISTPLEIKIFEKELEVGLEKLINQKKEDLRLSNTTFQDDVLAKKKEISKEEKELNNLKIEKKDLDVGGMEALEKRRIRFEKKMRDAEREKDDSKKKRDWYKKVNYSPAWTAFDSARKDTNTSKSRVEDLKKEWKKAQRNYKPFEEDLKNKMDLYKKAKEKLDDYDTKGLNALDEDRNSLTQQITDKQNELKKLNSDLKDLGAKGNAEAEYNGEIANKYRGLMGKLEALSLLTYEIKYDTVPLEGNPIATTELPESISESGIESSLVFANDSESKNYKLVERKEKTTIFYAKWLITFLFIFIEIAPILFKMMTESGPYDQELENLKNIKKDQFAEKLSRVRHEINTNIKIAVDNHQNRLDAEIIANEKLLKALAEAQAELAIEQVKDWKEEQLQKRNKTV